MTVDRIDPLSAETVRLGGISRILAKQLEELSGLETRAVILGHIVRGGTPTSYDRILATLFGVKAMELVLTKNFGKMVALKKGTMSSVPLSKVGGKIRGVPQDHMLLRTARKIGVSFGT
jgi:ATP-dependent phosphofructokinase / diphosphate-dependent phosphofructokinase